MKRWIRYILGGGIVLFLLIQLVPYGRRHTNPPLGSELAWSDLQTRALAQRACFDCHSNETVWPWYSRIAPVSWLVQHDVDEGRATMNFSDWSGIHREGSRGVSFDPEHHIAEAVESGDMPPWSYLPLHPSARLSPAEKQALVDGLTVILTAR